MLQIEGYKHLSPNELYYSQNNTEDGITSFIEISSTNLNPESYEKRIKETLMQIRNPTKITSFRKTQLEELLKPIEIYTIDTLLHSPKLIRKFVDEHIEEYFNGYSTRKKIITIDLYTFNEEISDYILKDSEPFNALREYSEEPDLENGFGHISTININVRENKSKVTQKDIEDIERLNCLNSKYHSMRIFDHSRRKFVFDSLGLFIHEFNLLENYKHILDNEKKIVESIANDLVNFYCIEENFDEEFS